jgi:RNA polymerase sigma factor (sigma-70 family)
MPAAHAVTDPNRTDTTVLRDMLTVHMPLVNLVIRRACFRSRFLHGDADDFAAHVRLKLVENDYCILRKYQGRSSLETYLETVVRRLLLDYRIALWGRWRPSAAAVRSGEIAMLLDRLLTRDLLTFDQAYEVLRTNYRLNVSREELYEISVCLPARTRPRLVLHEAPEVEASYGQPDSDLDRAEATERAAALKTALKEALRRLPPDDRHLLEMRFRDGRQVCDIARELGVDARPLYRKLERILAALRRPLAAYRDSQAMLSFDVSISW